jgi:soluble epoxide hydrolase/lipid-phosphate phosphatase
MALSSLPPIGKSIELDDGTRYAYAYAEPATSFQPTFLLHGLPSSSYDWRYQIEALKSNGFGILAPTC